MAAFDIEIEAISPIHLGSGQADVNVDAEVVHDALGLPYFPAKRLRGLLYESGREVVEMAELSGQTFLESDTLEALFHHQAGEQVQLIVPNFYLKDYDVMQRDWQYLEQRYPGLLRPEDVLKQYTDIRYQTRIDPATGTAFPHSLHNMQVVDAGVIFCGRIEILGSCAAYENALVLALGNLSAAGLKRNRGFGQVVCRIRGQKMERLVQQALKKEAM